MGEYVHSKQAQFNKSYTSCGVMEVHHLPNNTPPQTAFAILTALYHKANPRPSAFVMFSDVIEEGGEKSRGERLAAHIKTLPGRMWESPKEVNPKTGNTIRVWMWHLDHKGLRKLYQDELANRVSED